MRFQYSLFISGHHHHFEEKKKTSAQKKGERIVCQDILYVRVYICERESGIYMHHVCICKGEMCKRKCVCVCVCVRAFCPKVWNFMHGERAVCVVWGYIGCTLDCHACMGG